MSKHFPKTNKLLILAALLLTLIGCANKSLAGLPKDILGIGVGMGKTDAQKRLEEIAVFERSEDKGQQVWRLKDTSQFIILSVGYDAENKVRYVAGITNENGTRKLSYADVGDLNSSKQNVSPGNYEYIWDVPETPAHPAYQVVAHGNKPEYSMLLTLKKTGGQDPDEEERERR